MNARILVSVGLVALVLLVLFWFLDPGATSNRQDELTREPDAPEVSRTEPEAVDLLEVPLVPAAEEGGTQETRQVVPSEADAAAPRTWAEEETRWVDVRLIVPEGTPYDEQTSVLALAAYADPATLHGKNGPVRELRAGTEPLRIDGVLGVAPVNEGGEARLGLPPETSVAWLAVNGSYLYSLDMHQVEVGKATGPIELRPILGAWVSGHVLRPANDADIDLAGVEVTLTWSMHAALQLGAADSGELNLETQADANGRFEFRAVPAGKPQMLTTQSPTLSATFSEDLLALPGEHIEVELAPFLGGSVVGRVVDEQGNPIAGAEVHALGLEFLGNPSARLRQTESDGDGRFELSSVTPGRTWVRARHDEFQDWLSSPFDLADREPRDQGDIVLGHGLAIAGTVVFPDGSPATGTVVRVDPDLSENITGSPVDPRDYIGASNDDTVDDKGEFRITGTGPGPWVVSAQLVVEEAETEEDADAEEGPVPGRWSAGRDVVRAPLEELNLILAPPVHMSGEVIDGAGEPVAVFEINGARAGSQWYMPPSEERHQVFESKDGRFSMVDLRSGEWTFSAQAEGYARSEEVTLGLPSDEQLAFVLYRSVRLAGKVFDPDGRPVAGAEVSKELEGTEAIEAMQGRGDWPSAKSDEEGAFALAGLTPGTGSVMAKKDGFAPSEAVAFELLEGEEITDLILTLRRGATLSGEVYGADGKSAAGCLIIIQMPTLQERRITNTDSGGTFEEHGLTPGPWTVQAFPGIESLQSESGEALDRATLIAALKMTTVELINEGEEHVVLGEPPADPVKVHGQVTLAGNPVEESMISFVPTGGGGIELLKIKPLEADGSYAVQLDEPGDYLVTIQTTGTPRSQNSIEFRRSIPSGEDFELNFEMPLGRISGRVRGPDGEPLPDARVTLNMEGGLVFGTLFGGQYEEAVTNTDGNYDILYLRPGRYAVAAGGAYLGGFLGDGDPLGRRVTSVEIVEGQWLQGLDFRLEEPGAIHGTVRDAAGALVDGASIFVRDEEGHLVELFSVAQTNASGSFDYPGLTPGHYTVTARTSSLASAGGTPVQVRPGESTEVTVAVDAGTMLLVTLVDKSGANVPSRVSVVDGDGHEMNGMLGLAEILARATGGLGSEVQRIGPLAPGFYKVRAFAEDGRSTERSIALSGKPEHKVKLRLK